MKNLNDLEQIMLTRKGFTLADIVECTGEQMRVIDRTIQKLRKKGWISYQRVGKKCVWAATAEGEVAYGVLS